MVDPTAFLNDPAGYGGGDCASGGDLSKLNGEIGYGKIGCGLGGVRVRVFAVVVFDHSVKSVGYKGFFGRYISVLGFFGSFVQVVLELSF